MSVIVVADSPVADPLGRLTAYATRERTLIRYDLAGQEDPFSLSRAEVARTRSSRPGSPNASSPGSSSAAKVRPRRGLLWTQTPTSATPIRNSRVISTTGRRPLHALPRGLPGGVSGAKISKVLHLKRPALFPILDSHLLKTYRRSARQAARRHPERGYRCMYWAAIRDDLRRNRTAIAELKAACQDDPRDQVRRLSRLTDLRVLDILTW